MSHSFAGCASMARFTFRTSARRTISRCWVPPASWRTFLLVPLRQQEELIGTLDARRTEVRPFTPAQIKLLETFADQAVIAIENVRLFQELKESLEQQTATSEILGVIASSPTDIQPVLDAVAENAARLCDATMLRSVASKVTCSGKWRAMGQLPVPWARRPIRLSSWRSWAEPYSTGRRSMFMTLQRRNASDFPDASTLREPGSSDRAGSAVAA